MTETILANATLVLPDAKSCAAACACPKAASPTSTAGTPCPPGPSTAAAIW